MKTSKAYFNRFKKEFLRWRDAFGLTQYRIIFHHELLKSKGVTYFAKMTVYEKDKLAEVFLTAEIKDPKNDEGPEAHAKHEAIHLLIHRLSWLGESRYLETDDIEDEAEAIVTRLEKVL